MPYFQKRNHHTAHSLRNIFLAATSSVVAITVFAFILQQTFTFTEQRQLGLLNFINVPALWALVISIICIDAWQYVWHRLNHIVPFLWRFHQVHHADKELDASSGVRFHPGEILLSSLSRVLVIPLFGIQLEQLITYEILMIGIVFFHHSNIRLNATLDQLLRILIITPHVHRLHHSDLRAETDSNYGNIFSIWDRAFGSYTMRSIEKNFMLGLGNQFTEKEWNSYRGMLKMPLKKKQVF